MHQKKWCFNVIIFATQSILKMYTSLWQLNNNDVAVCNIYIAAIKTNKWYDLEFKYDHIGSLIRLQIHRAALVSLSRS